MLISVDFHADLGFQKKPDMNDGIYLTYNLLHKPTILGIAGAILGLGGYEKSGVIPEYQLRLAGLKVAVSPLNAERGTFNKEVIRYTNAVGYANDDGGTLIVDEQTLIKPSYRVYFFLEDENPDHILLNDRLRLREAEFIPYLGKNEHQLWWDSYTIWKWEAYKPESLFKIHSIYKKSSEYKTHKKETGGRLAGTLGTYMYFERLPVGFDNRLAQYELREFALTDFELEPNNPIEDLLRIWTNERSESNIIQVF